MYTNTEYGIYWLCLQEGVAGFLQNSFVIFFIDFLANFLLIFSDFLEIF